MWSAAADLFPSRPAAPGTQVEAAAVRWHLVEDHPDAGGLPLLMLHGYLAASHVWQPLRDALGEHGARRSIAADLPGCGYSDRPSQAPYDVPWLRDRTVELLDALRIERAILVAHSLGGAVALHLAAHAADRVAALVLLAPLCFSTPLPKILAPAARHPGVFKLFFRTLGRPLVVPAMLGNYHGTKPEQARAMARLSLAHLDAAGGWTAATRMGVAAAFRADMNAWLGRVQAPALVVYGDGDRVHPSALGQRLVDSLPRARACEVEACGHNPHLEQPAWVAREISGWLHEQGLEG